MILFIGLAAILQTLFVFWRNQYKKILKHGNNVKLGTTPRNGGKEQGRGTERKPTDLQIQHETCLEATK